MPLANAPRTAYGYVTDAQGYGAAMYDLLETVPDLIWPSTIDTFSKMRYDPRVQATLNAYSLPLRSGNWAVNPKGCRDEVVQFVADSLGLPVAGDNDGEGPARRRGVDWDDHLRLALLHLIFGHMPFAQRYDIVDGKAKLIELSERMPNTISEIRVNTDGSLKEIVQYGEKTPIPASALVWYAHEREGAAWQGKSMIRAAYGPWLLKHEMWRVLATSSRRFGAGTPVVTAPPGATPSQITEAARLSQSIRVGDQGGTGLPNGFTLTLAGITGSVPDTLGFVRYLDQQIAESVLASVLNLDSSPNGSRALGETMIGLLEMSWQAVAREITGPATRLAVQIVDYNFGENENVPRIQVTDVNRPEATAEALKSLMDCGAIKYDPNLETAMRERYSLPPRDESYVPPTPPPLADPNTAPDGQQGQPGKPTDTPDPTNDMGTRRKQAVDA